MSDTRIRIARANTPIDTSSVIGWGVDADPENDPTYPIRDRSRDAGLTNHGPAPSPQESDVEVLQSVEFLRRPAVFGTSTPPSGVSGMMRRAAFRWSESHWLHWLILLGADRVNMIEGIVEDLGQARVPNIPAEMGVRAEWQHNRKGLLIKTGVAIGITLALAAVIRSRQADKDTKKLTY